MTTVCDPTIEAELDSILRIYEGRRRRGRGGLPPGASRLSGSGVVAPDEAVDAEVAG